MVILGLGSNEGNRAANLRAAVHALDRSRELAVRRISPLYESDAMLAPGAPASWNRPFLNLAVECAWRRSGERPAPERLLELVKEIEARLGRARRERWAPRSIDIDVLDWDGGPVALGVGGVGREGGNREAAADRESGNRGVSAGALQIPHIGLRERPFALLPLLDLWPGYAGGGAEALRWRLAEDTAPFRTRRAGRGLTGFIGVLNLTPDSFSDGGRFHGDPARALAQARALVAAGAEAIDVGSESTRPGATPVAIDEELARLLPALELLRAELPREIALSVDTRHAEVARRALTHGVDWINDVTGFNDPAMLEAVRDSSCRVIAMHSLSIPPSRDRYLPDEREPTAFLLDWGRTTLARLERAGIARERVTLDPGIGFGTLPGHAWRILETARALRAGWDVDVLIGHSRKSFMASLVPEAAERDLETAVVSAALVRQGVDWLRVHDVAASARVVRAWMRVDGVVEWACP